MSIRIAFTRADALISRCAKGSATVIAGRSGFDDGAVVPGRDWNPLTAADAESLRATRADDPATVIELGCVVPHGPPGRWPIGQATNFDPFRGRASADFLAFVDSLPRQATTTIDGSTGRHIGIHLDNFDRLPLSRRADSRRRLGLNLGSGVRYLLLGGIDILEICGSAGISSPRHCPHTDDIRGYVAAGHAFPVLRLRLDPGDAYIAPTELIPHDGSTLIAETASRIAFWVGHWPTGLIESLV